MEFPEAFIAYLNGYNGLNALIGNKVFPDFVPQEETLPAIVYHLISETPDYTLQGEQNLKEVNYQFDCHGTTDYEALQVYKQLKLAFKNYSGNMGSFFVQAIQIEAALGKDYEPTTQDHDYKIEYKFYYTE